MSGEGGPIASACQPVALIELPLELYSETADVLADIAASERGAIARRIGAIVAQCQKEAREGTVPVERVELLLVLLADDVRGGLHGAGD